MSIIVSCTCGKSYPVKEQFAGKRVQCPGCKRVLTVPGGGSAPARAVAPKPAPAARAASPIRERETRQDFAMPTLNGDDGLESSGGSSRGLFVGLVVFFLLLVLGGGGAVFYFVLRDEGDGQTAATTGSTEKKQGGTTQGKDEVKLAENRKPAEQGKVAETKPPMEDKKPPVEKKHPEEKKPPEMKQVPPEPKRAPTAGTTWQGHSARILSVGFPRDGRFAISAAGGVVLRDGMKAPATDSTLRLWDLSTGAELKRIEAFPRGLSMAAFDPNGKYAVIAEVIDPRDEIDGKPGACDLHLWDIAEKREVRALKGHRRAPVCAVFTADGKRLLSGGRDATLHVFDVDTGDEIGSGYDHKGIINDVAVSSDGRYAMTACFDRTARLYDLMEKKLVKELPRHQDIVWSVAFTADGKFAVSGGGNDYDGVLGKFVPGSRDYDIRLWDVTTGQEVRRFKGHTNQVTSLAFSADGRRLLSAAQDKSVRLWHVPTGRELTRFEEHTDWVQCVAFFPDGRRALSGGYDKTLRVFTLPFDIGDLAKRLLEKGADGDRVAMLSEIGRYGPEAKDTVPTLLKLLTDRDPAVKRAAMETLAKVGTAGKEHVELLVPLLKDTNFLEGRQLAIDVLASAGKDAKPALPEVLKLLEDKNAATRVKAIGIIAGIGDDAREKAYTPLLDLLRDPDAQIAKAAGEALTKLGKPMKTELPTLIKFVTDSNEGLRQYGILAITDLGEDAADTVPLLTTALEKDQSAAVRMLALAALVKVQTNGKMLVGPLGKALGDADANIPPKAAEAIVALPPDTPGLLPLLMKCLHHADAAVQKTADDALEKFPFKKDREQINFINEGLRSKREPVRLRMLKIVAKMGRNASDTVPGLIEVVKSSMGETRMTAVNALGDIGLPARAAGPVLAGLLKDGDRKSRLAICLVLGKIDALEKKEAISYLIGLLKVDNPADEEAKKDRDMAAKALMEIGIDVVDDLVRALATEFAGGSPATPLGVARAEARVAAIQILLAINKKTKEPLRKALLPLAAIEGGDPVPELKAMAREARKELQKPK